MEQRELCKLPRRWTDRHGVVHGWHHEDSAQIRRATHCGILLYSVQPALLFGSLENIHSIDAVTCIACMNNGALEP